MRGHNTTPEGDCECTEARVERLMSFGGEVSRINSHPMRGLAGAGNSHPMREQG